MAGDELFEFGATVVEGGDAADGVCGRDETDNEGWDEDEDVGYPGVVCVRQAPDIFVDVETVSLSDIICVNDLVYC